MDRYPSRPHSNEPRRPRTARGRAGFLVAIILATCSSFALAQQPAPVAAPPTGRPVVRPQVTVPPVGGAVPTPQQRMGVPQPQAPQAQVVVEDPPVANAPFQLTPAEQLKLDEMLKEWEHASEKVTIFRCEITRYENDPVFKKHRKAVGDIKYRAPDRGLYRVKDAETDQWIEDWRCDGQAIYEFNFEKKQLIERTLPPELRGKAIANGPLPFIFSAKADTLKKRYFLRLKTPPKSKDGRFDKMICLEAYPRYQSDAANFRRAELLIDPASMFPFALHLEMPNGKNTTDHVFQNIKTNDPVGDLIGDYSAPRTPLLGGWKRLINPEQGAADPNAGQAQTTVPPAGAPAAPPQQATRPTTKPR